MYVRVCVCLCVREEGGRRREKKERRELIKEEGDKLKIWCPTENNDETNDVNNNLINRRTKTQAPTKS